MNPHLWSRLGRKVTVHSLDNLVHKDPTARFPVPDKAMSSADWRLSLPSFLTTTFPA